MDWDEFFLGLAEHVSIKSKDRSTKVGAVIVGPDNEVLSLGWNGFPRGVGDDPEWYDNRYNRPDKYEWTEHAERNAIFNAARHGIALRGSTMYTTHAPCASCARAIVQSGITSVRSGDQVTTGGRSASIADTILSEGHVVVTSLGDR